MNLLFKLKKETKGALCFQEVDANDMALEGDEAVVGTLYIRKAALPKLTGGATPKNITVTIG